jgi:ABC-type Fe3+ transport system substrate-binding protein/tetrahydromethanopterin S-methyltransferase subunit B
VEAKGLRKNIVTPLMTAVLVCSMLFSFASIIPVKAQADQIVVITPNSSSIQQLASENFTAWYKARTGRDVTITFDSKDTATSLSLIQQAGGDPNLVRWDVWWGGGLDAFRIAKQAELLSPFFLPDDQEWIRINESIPASFGGLPLKDTDYMWWGSALSGFGIVYNKDYLQANDLVAPNDWIDLANPVYMGHIVACPPSKSGSNLMVMQILLQRYGWDQGWALINKMGANIAEYTARSSEVGPLIGRGEYGIAPIIDQFGFGQAKAYPEQVVFFYPPADSAQKNTVINPDSVAILKGIGDNNPVAVEFMKWVLGDDGQRMLFVEPIDRLSVRTDVYKDAPAGYFNPFETQMGLITYNDTLGTLRFYIIQDLFDVMLINAKDDLENAWTAYNDADTFIKAKKAAGYDVPNAEAKLAEAYAALVSLPISDHEAQVISVNYTSNRETYKVEWLNFVIQKYANTATLSHDAQETAQNEATTADLVASLQAQINSLNTQISSLNTQVTNNLYYGIVGGTVIGLIIGFLVAYMLIKKQKT